MPDKPNELPGDVKNTEPVKSGHRRNWSTDTIVHKVLLKADIPSIYKLSTGLLHPSVGSESDIPSTQEQKKEKSFLWWPRRVITDPGMWLTKRLNPFAVHPPAGKTEETLVPNSNENLSPVPSLEQLRQEFEDHFHSLQIPDWHLHDMPYVDKVEEFQDPLIPIKQDGSPIAASGLTRDSLSRASASPSLSTATNLSDCQTLIPSTAPSVSGTEEAIAISSPLSSKGSMKPRIVHRSLFPVWRSQESQVPRRYTQRINHGWGRERTYLRDDAIELQTLRRASSPHKGLVAAIPESHIRMDMTGTMMKDLGGSASTHTITTTGSDPVPHLPSEVSPSQTASQKKGGGKKNTSSISSHGAIPSTLNSQGNNGTRHGASSSAAAEKGRNKTTTTPSPRTLPPSTSQNLVHVHETRDAATSLTDLAICRKPCLTIFSRPSRVEGSCPRNLISVPTNNKKRAGPAPIKIQLEGQELGGLTAPPKHHQIGKAAVNKEKRHEFGGVHQRQAPDEIEIETQEAMIKAAARVAFRRSQAREITITATEARRQRQWQHSRSSSSGSTSSSSQESVTRRPPVPVIAIPNPEEPLPLILGKRRGSRFVRISSLDAVLLPLDGDA